MFEVVWKSYQHVVVQDLSRLIITGVWWKYEAWQNHTSTKVNKLQMRLPYYRIYSNNVCNMKKRKISLQKYSFYKQKSYFRYTLSDLCGVLTSRGWFFEGKKRLQIIQKGVFRLTKAVFFARWNVYS